MKIWHPGRTPDDADTKLRHMIRNPVEPDLGATWQITWPQHMVQENRVTVGYTMPILDPSASWEAIVEYYNRRAAQTTEQEQGRELRIDDRVRMATNLALGFRAVHAAGYVIGDVNEKNVEVNRQNDIAMVDCDSYGFIDARTGTSFSNHMGRPEFQAPEAQDDYANRTQNHDRFGLAVIIFHLLTGYHPYTVVNQPDHPQPGDRIKAWLFPPSNRTMVEAPAPYDQAWEALTDGQQELFKRCFDWQYQGQQRPMPEEWLEALQEMPAQITPPSTPPTPAPANRPPPPQPRQTAYRPPPPSPPRQRPHRQPSPAPAPPPRTTPTPVATPPRRRVRWRTVLIGAAALFIAYVSCNLVVIAFEEWRDFREEREFARMLQESRAAAINGVTARPTVSLAITQRPTATLASVPTRSVEPTEVPPATVASPTIHPPTAASPAVAVPTKPAPTRTPTALAPDPTVAPTAIPASPTATPTPVEWLYPNPTHSVVRDLARGEEMRLQGCYLGNHTSARRFRLASWDVWDPSLYGNQLKFVKIITNNGVQIPLEQGMCYAARVVKHVDSPEEYVCLDSDSTHPQQFPCDNSRDREVVPTFILYPSTPDDPHDFTDNLVRIDGRK